MQQPTEVEVEEDEQIVERVAAVDVAKVSGMVCTRVPHESVPGKRVTKVWSVPSTTRALVELANHLRCQGIQRVVLESTSDYWRPFYYLLETAGLDVQLVNARDVKNLPGRPKTDLLTELPVGFFGRCVRRWSGVVRFRPRDQRRGRAAGVVRVGGAAARLA
jgi:hypothetical protein